VANVAGEDYQISELPDGKYSVQGFANGFHEIHDSLADAKAAAERRFAPIADNTKFSNYQLPGGENYRELLLTLPERGSKESPDWNSISAQNAGGNFRSS